MHQQPPASGRLGAHHGGEVVEPPVRGTHLDGRLVIGGEARSGRHGGSVRRRSDSASTVGSAGARFVDRVRRGRSPVAAWRSRPRVVTSRSWRPASRAASRSRRTPASRPPTRDGCVLALRGDRPVACGTVRPSRRRRRGDQADVGRSRMTRGVGLGRRMLAHLEQVAVRAGPAPDQARHQCGADRGDRPVRPVGLPPDPALQRQPVRRRVVREDPRLSARATSRCDARGGHQVPGVVGDGDEGEPFGEALRGHLPAGGVDAGDDAAGLAGLADPHQGSAADRRRRPGRRGRRPRPRATDRPVRCRSRPGPVWRRCPPRRPARPRSRSWRAPGPSR